MEPHSPKDNESTESFNKNLFDLLRFNTKAADIVTSLELITISKGQTQERTVDKTTLLNKHNLFHLTQINDLLCHKEKTQEKKIWIFPQTIHQLFPLITEEIIQGSCFPKIAKRLDSNDALNLIAYNGHILIGMANLKRSPHADYNDEVVSKALREIFIAKRLGGFLLP